MTVLDSRLFASVLVSVLVLGAVHASEASAQEDDRAIMAPRLHLRGLLAFGGTAAST